MYRTLQRCRAVRLAVSLSLGLSPLWIARCGSATLPEPPNPYEVLSSYTPRLEVALKRCAAALQKRSFGDVIIAVVPTPDAPPKFELDVSRSLGEEIVPCLRARFQPILATMLAHNRHASYDLYATVEVGPRRARPRVDASFMRLWLEGGGAGSAAAARLK